MHGGNFPPRRKVYWNLGVNINNNAEAYALWIALKILSKGKIKNIDIYGDS